MTESPPDGGRRPQPVVAIDGPAGSGKSTAARQLAERLGFLLVDTGALYRAVALVSRERGVDWEDADALGALAAGLDVAMRQQLGRRPDILVDGRDRTEELRTPEVSTGASVVSRHPPVRTALLGTQRTLGRLGGVVLEGRDIGTVVFPDAEVKVFLTASPEIRARRRTEELAARGRRVDFQETLREVLERDRRDAQRPVAPLRPADDALLLDTTTLDISEVVDQLVEVVRETADPSRRRG